MGIFIWSYGYANAFFSRNHTLLHPNLPSSLLPSWTSCFLLPFGGDNRSWCTVQKRVDWHERAHRTSLRGSECQDFRRMKLHPGWTIRPRVVYFAYLGFSSSRCFFPCFFRNPEFSGKVFCVSCFLLQWALMEMGNCSRWRQIFQPSSGWWVGPVFSFSFFRISSKGCQP